jgi:hypothetical protein
LTMVESSLALEQQQEATWHSTIVLS